MTLAELQHLAGVRDNSTRATTQSSNISKTAAAKVAYMKQHGIEPGTQEWFSLPLWFKEGPDR